MAAQDSPRSHSLHQKAASESPAANHDTPSNHQPLEAPLIRKANRNNRDPRQHHSLQDFHASSLMRQQDVRGDDVADPCIDHALADGNGHSAQPCHLSLMTVLPPGTKPDELVGEGAANVVFSLHLPEGYPADGSSHAHTYVNASDKVIDLAADRTRHIGKLLRVAKVASRGDLAKFDYLAQQRFYDNVIEPMFQTHAIGQECINLRGSGIVDRLNDFLQERDHQRKKKFRGSYIGETDVGFLVGDLRPTVLGASLLEFKPKWLSQSPSAPKDSIRCRQCALELQRFVTRPPRKAKAAPTDRPCPLALATDGPWQASSPLRIAPGLAKSVQGEVFESIANSGLLRILRAKQAEYDKRGPLNASPSDEDLGVAMTLRDCTCYTIVTKGSHTSLLLGDFDWKGTDEKCKHWHDTEAKLIEGGFYTATRLLVEGGRFHIPTLCALEWSSKVRPHQSEILYVLDHETPKSDEYSGVDMLRPNDAVYRHRAEASTLRARLLEFESRNHEALSSKPQ